MPTDKLTDFLELVSQQIRWKKAQPMVLEEIQNHIKDQEMAFIEEGMDEDKAIEKAIREMGDPVVLGEQLNRVHKPKPDWTLLMLISGILFIGLIIQYYLIPTYNPHSERWVAVSMFYGQLRGIIVGIVVMVAAYFCDFTIIGKYPKIIFLILFSICIYYIFKGNYVRGGIADTIYPLLLFPTAYAGFIYSMRNKRYVGIFLCGVGVLIPAIIAIISPNMTTLLLLCISCFIILTSAVAKGWFQVRKLWGYLLINIPTIVISIVLFYHLLLSQGYRAERLKAFLTFSDPMGAGWINSQVRLLLFHAKLIGKGLPIGQETKLTSNILPAIHTDFMLTYIIYKLGWIVFIGIILLFSALIVRGLILSQKQKSVLGYLTSQAIIITFTIQCFLYISANLGFMLFAPLSFPLLSYGAKYIVVNMFLLGLLLSVFRTGDYVRENKGILGEALPFIQYDEGTIHINLKKKTTE